MKTKTYTTSTGELIYYIDKNDGHVISDTSIFNYSWHRLDGPAAESEQGWAYFVEGILTRTDGPALCNRSSQFINLHGHSHQWVIDGMWMNTKIVPWCEERDINWISPSPEDLTLIQMKWIHV